MRLYRALLVLYPSSRRAEYSKEMCEVFRIAAARCARFSLDAAGPVARNCSRSHPQCLRCSMGLSVL
jgi:hypothetical protein